MDAWIRNKALSMVLMAPPMAWREGSERTAFVRARRMVGRKDLSLAWLMAPPMAEKTALPEAQRRFLHTFPKKVLGMVWMTVVPMSDLTAAEVLWLAVYGWRSMVDGLWLEKGYDGATDGWADLTTASRMVPPTACLKAPSRELELAYKSLRLRSMLAMPPTSCNSKFPRIGSSPSFQRSAPCNDCPEAMSDPSLLVPLSADYFYQTSL
jgi:hypothetical protein